jgi:hypothetical protein
MSGSGGGYKQLLLLLPLHQNLRRTEYEAFTATQFQNET